MGVVIFHEGVSILAHLEEVCFFLCHVDFSATVGAFAVNQLAFCPERFTGSAIPTVVCALVDVPLFIELFEHLLDLFFVIFVCCADEFIVGSVHQIPNIFDAACHFVHKLLGSFSCCGCFKFNFFTVLVSAGLETDVVSLLTFESCKEVCEDDFISVAYMRLA